MNTMPLHQKLIACAILLLVRGKSKKEIPLIKVCERYIDVCKSKSIRHISQSEVVNALEMLESAGIILIKKCKETIKNKIILRLQEDELTHVLDDKVLINSILA
jgi:Cdc6-like AAA superfamily ATPase